MSFITIMVVACAFVAVAARSIKAVPWLWYGVALALDAAYVYGIAFSLPPAVLQVLSILVQRCTLATVLFVIVMYCGVFPEHSAVRRTVGPIRGELSIVACILAGAHCLNYLSSYLGVLMRNIGVLGGNQLASLALALVLMVLLVVLGVTSVRAVRRRMKASTWKSVQRSSYVFFGMIYVHELLILYPSVAKGSGDALVSCVAGGIVFAFYYAARVAKHVADKGRNSVQSVAGSETEGESGVHISQA